MRYLLQQPLSFPARTRLNATLSLCNKNPNNMASIKQAAMSKCSKLILQTPYIANNNEKTLGVNKIVYIPIDKYCRPMPQA